MTTGPAELDGKRPGISGGAGIGGGPGDAPGAAAPAPISFENVTAAPAPAPLHDDDDANDGRKLPDIACRSASSNDTPSWPLPDMPLKVMTVAAPCGA